MQIVYYENLALKSFGKLFVKLSIFDTNRVRCLCTNVQNYVISIYLE